MVTLFRLRDLFRKRMREAIAWTRLEQEEVDDDDGSPREDSSITVHASKRRRPERQVTPREQATLLSRKLHDLTLEQVLQENGGPVSWHILQFVGLPKNEGK